MKPMIPKDKIDCYDYPKRFIYIVTLLNVYVDLVVFTRIAGTT